MELYSSIDFEVEKLCMREIMNQNAKFSIFQALFRKVAYSARTAHPFQRNGAPFRFKLSKTQQVD